MTDYPLGRLAPIDLREIWASEASNFTPWLTQEDNLQVLGEILSIDLELEAQEKAVWPLRAARAKMRYARHHAPRLGFDAIIAPMPKATSYCPAAVPA